MIDYSIKNPLVVNLFLLLIVVIGIISWHSMPEELFPVGLVVKQLDNLLANIDQDIKKQE